MAIQVIERVRFVIDVSQAVASAVFLLVPFKLLNGFVILLVSYQEKSTTQAIRPTLLSGPLAVNHDKLTNINYRHTCGCSSFPGITAQIPQEWGYFPVVNKT